MTLYWGAKLRELHKNIYIYNNFQSGSLKDSFNYLIGKFNKDFLNIYFAFYSIHLYRANRFKNAFMREGYSMWARRKNNVSNKNKALLLGEFFYMLSSLQISFDTRNIRWKKLPWFQFFLKINYILALHKQKKRFETSRKKKAFPL